MKVFNYDSNAISLFQSIIGQHITQLINGQVSVVLDFGNFHILGQLIEQPADSPHRFGEVIALSFEKQESDYKMNAIDEVVIEGETIKGIWILRSLIYFSNLITYNSREEALAGVPEPKSDFEERVRDLVGQSSAGFFDYIINPNSEAAKQIPNEIINLVDVGILLQTENKYYACIPVENKYFSTIQVLSEFELEEKITPHYEMVAVSL